MIKLELKDIIILLIIVIATLLVAQISASNEYEEIIDEQQKVIELQRKIIKLHEYNEELPSITNLDIKKA